MTVRQVFYQLETAGIVEKTEGGYRQVQQQVLKMRREGLLTWEFITDGTRWQRKPETYTDAGNYIERVSRSYRRDLWQEQDVRIEIWLEKDALADVIVDVTDRWDVSLMVSRGQSSATFLHSAAMTAKAAFENKGLTTHIYALYDYDAGGERAFRTVERELPEYAPDVPINVERLAVTDWQIAKLALPTRPAKRSDPEAATWGDIAIELDAIDPATLVEIVEEAIVEHVDEHAWLVEQRVEQEERKGLLALAEGLERMTAEPIPSEAALLLQLAAFAGNEAAGSFLELRCLCPDGGPGPRALHPGPRAVAGHLVASTARTGATWTWAPRLASAKPGPPGTWSASGHSGRTVTPRPRSRRRAFTPIPGIVVETSTGRMQALWPLRAAVAPTWARRANRRLAHKLGADMAATDPARILRVIGSRNWKHTPPPPVICLRCELDGFDLGDVVGTLPDAPVTRRASPQHDPVIPGAEGRSPGYSGPSERHRSVNATHFCSGPPARHGQRG